MFAINCWYIAVDVEDVTQEKPLGIKLAGEHIVLYRDSKNKVVAMADLCPHRLAPLSEGNIEGDDIRCMYHGIKFDSQGQCNEVPGQDMIPKVLCVKPYAVHEGHEWIWVWIGDQDKADEALLPDQHFHDPNVFNVRKGSVAFDANYELFNDNTCDLSHVAFVHASTFAEVSGGDEFAEKMPTITLHERHVEVNRWMVGIPHPVLGCNVDFSSRFKHMLPGVFIMDLQYHPVGTAEKLNFEAPPEDLKPLHHSGTIQTMRPITETTSRFYFSIVSPKWVAEEALDGDFEFGKQGFIEDKAICEAQQRMISAHPNVPLRQTSHDKAGSHIRKLIRATLES